MTRGVRRAIEAGLGIVVLAAAVSWLSGGFAARVGPADVEAESLADSAASAGSRVLEVESVTEPAIEWVSGQVTSARFTAVSSRVLARIESVAVRAGSNVSEGDVLVTLDARDLEARVREAQEDLHAVEARLELARREEARNRELFRTGVVSQRQVDVTRSELSAAKADVEGRREAVAVATTALSFAGIRAAVSGSIIDRLAEPGDMAVPGKPLLRIYDPSVLRVEAPVRESLAVQLSVGDQLRVDVPALSVDVEGRIDEIVPFAEAGSRTLLVKVNLPRTDARLFAGMYARVAVPAGMRERLVVPEAAVERIGQLEFTTVVDAAGVAERRLVTTGELGRDGSIEVLSGLASGERVRVSSSRRSVEPEAAALENP